MADCSARLQDVHVRPPRVSGCDEGLRRSDPQVFSGANPLKSTIDPVPYTGVQYVDIPEFEQIGDFTSQQLAGALSGSMSTDEAIAASETKIKEIMKEADYTK